MPKPGNPLIKILNDEEKLIHWVSNKYPLIKEGKLNVEKLIDISRLPGLSHNKIPPSKTLDIFLVVSKDEKYLEYWEEGSIVSKVLRSHCYYDVINRNYFFIRIGDLIYSDSYHKTVKQKKINHPFSVSPIHKPLNSNYSHFELEISADHTTISNLRSKGWRKILGNSIRDRYKDLAYFND